MSTCKIFDQKNLTNILVRNVLAPLAKYVKENNNEALQIAINEIQGELESYEINNVDTYNKLINLISKVINIDTVDQILRGAADKNVASIAINSVYQAANSVFSKVKNKINDNDNFNELKEIDVNDADDLDMGGIPSSPVSISIEDIFREYPLLRSYFEETTTQNISSNSIVNFQKGELVDTSDKLNLLLCEAKNEYYKTLKNYIVQKYKEEDVNLKLPENLYTPSGKLIPNAQKYLDKLIDESSKVFSTNLGVINKNYLDRNQYPEKIESVNALVAYIMLIDNNFDHVIKESIGNRVKIKNVLPLLSEASQYKYALVLQNRRSKDIVGDDRLTDGKAKAGSISKFLVETTPILNSITGEPTGEYVSYEQFFTTTSRFSDPEITSKVTSDRLIKILSNLREGNSTLTMKKLLQDILVQDKITSTTTETEKKTFKQLSAMYIKELQLGQTELNILYSIYKRFYASSINSLYGIEQKHFRNSPTINNWSYLDSVTQLMLRIDISGYLKTDKTGEPQKISPSMSKSILPIIDKMESRIAYDSFGNDVLRQVYSLEKDKNKNSNNILFQFVGKYQSGKPCTVILNTNNRSGQKVIFHKNGNTYYLSSEQFIQPVEMSKLYEYSKNNNSDLDLTEPQKNFMDCINTISDFTGFQFLGKDFDVLEKLLVLYNNDVLKMLENLFSIVYANANAILLSIEYDDSEYKTFKDFLLSQRYALKEHYNYYSGDVKLNRTNIGNSLEFLAIAFHQAKGKVVKTLKDSQSNAIPLTRGYTLANHIQEDVLNLLSRKEHCYGKTLFGNPENLKLIGRALLYVDEANFFGEVKNIRKLNESELNYSFLVNRFFNALRSSDYNTQPVNYSDKPSIEVFPIPLSGLKYGGKSLNLKSMSFDDIKQLIKATIGGYYQDQLLNTVLDYAKIFLRNGNIPEFISERLPEKIRDRIQDNIEKSQASIAALIQQIEEKQADIDNTIDDGKKKQKVQEKLQLEAKLSRQQLLKGFNLKDFTEILKVVTEKEFRELAWNNNNNPVKIIEEVHFGKGDTFISNGVEYRGLKPNTLAVYSGTKMYRDKFEEHLQVEYKKFIRDLINCDFNLYTQHYDGSDNEVVKEALENTMKSEIKNWVKNSRVLLAKDENGKEIDTIEKLNDSKILKLNPILERYFLVTFLLSYNLRLITTGSELGHTNKAKIEKKDGEYDEFKSIEAELSSRDSSANKRHIDMGAPGTLTARSSIYGIPKVLREAIIKDEKALVHNINGEKGSVDACDGGAPLNPVIALLYLDGMQDCRLGGETFKTMRSEYQERHGTKILYKDAEYPRYNNVFRDNQKSTNNPLDNFRKMMDMEWNVEHDEADTMPEILKKYDKERPDLAYRIDITKNLFGNKVTIAQRFPGGLYFKNGTKVYKLEKIESKEEYGKYDVTYVQVEFKNNTATEIEGTSVTTEKFINSNWDLYQVLGSCYSGHFNLRGKFIYDDSSLFALVNYINNTGKAYNSTGGTRLQKEGGLQLSQDNTWQPLKNKMIATTPFLTAVKTGAANVNDSDVLSDPNKKFRYTLMSSKNWFAVQDYDHTVTDGEAILTEFSQVITSMAAGGYLHNNTKELFRSLSSFSLLEVADLIDAVKKYVNNNFDPESKSKIYHIIGQLLIKSENKESISMTSGLINQIQKVFKNASRKGKIDHNSDPFYLNFSSPANFAKTIVKVASAVNKIAVKRKYPGGGMIMIPAYNSSMFFNFPGSHSSMTYQDIVNEVYSSIPINDGGNIAYVKTKIEKQQIDLGQTERVAKVVSAITVQDDGENNYIISNSYQGKPLLPDPNNYFAYGDFFSHVVSFLENTKPGDTFKIANSSVLNTIVQVLVDKGILTKEINNRYYQYTIVQQLSQEQAADSYIEVLDRNNYSNLKSPEEVDLYEEGEIKNAEGKTLTKDEVIKNNQAFKVTPKNLMSYEQLLPEDNIILADAEGNLIDLEGNVVTKPVVIKIDSIDTFYDLIDKKIHFYKSLSSPKNLGSAQIIITKNDGQKISIYSIPAIRDAFKSLEDIQNDTNTTAKEKKLKKLEHLKKISQIQQLLDMGYMPTAKNFTFDENTILEGNSQFEKINSIDTGAYEAVLPAIYKEEFGLREGDSLYDVLKGGVQYFRERWEENHQISAIQHDMCFTRNNNKHRYIQFDRDRIRKTLINEAYTRIDPKTQEKYIVDDEENRLYTYQVPVKQVDDEGNVTYAKDKEGNIIYEDYTIQMFDPNGEEVFWCANEEAALSLYDKEEFDSLKINENTDKEQIIKSFISLGQTKEHRLQFLQDKNISELSLQDLIHKTNIHFKPTDGELAYKFNSFKKSLEIIAARIPAQTLQSFMKMKVIAFTGRDSNAIMVSHYQLWLQGSDFDIDKAYVMGFEFSNAGKIIGWSPFFSMQSKSKVDLSFKLPAPTNKKTKIKQSGIDITQDVINIKNKIKELSKVEELSSDDFISRLQGYLNLGDLLEFVVPLLNKVGTNNITFNSNNVALKDVEIIKDYVIDKHNSYFSNISNVKPDKSLPNKKQIIRAFKNLVSRDIMYGSSHILNASLAQSPITMGDARVAADESELGKEDKFNTHWSPTYIPKIQNISMQGKEGIGVAANGEKVFFTLLYYCTDAILSGDTKRIQKILFNVKHTLGGEEHTKNLIANINLNYIKGIDVNKLSENKKLISNLIKGLYYKDLDTSQVANILSSQLGFQYDQSLVISALLSAATDNAKELILGKINADPNFMNVYLYAIMLGYDFTDISKFMTNKNISNLLSLCRPSMYDEFNTIKSENQAIKALKNGPIPDYRISDGIDKMINLRKKLLINYLNDKYDRQELLFKERFIKVTKDGIDSRKIEDLNSKELLQLAYLNGYDINEILKPNDFNFVGNANLNMILFDRYVKQWSKLQSIISGENFFEDLEQFELLRKGGQEITDVAAMLKINQGLGVTALDKVNFITKIEKMYYDMVHDDYKPIGKSGIRNSLMKGSEKMTKEQAEAIVKYAERNDLLHKLDLMRFLKEDEVDYRNVVLAITNSRKYTFNGFDVIDKVEHINTLYQILYYVSEADNSTSDRMKKLLQLKRFISDYNIDKSDMSVISSILNQMLVYNWVTVQGFQITLKEGDKYVDKNKLVPVEETETLNLNTEENLNTFKYWFETTFLRRLKSDPALRNNQFIQELHMTYESNSFTGKNRCILGIEEDFSENSFGKHEQRKGIIIEDFKALQSVNIDGMPITDWLFLYNLIVYKDQYGPKRFQPLFTFILKDKKSLAFKYNSDIGKNDYSNISNIGELNEKDVSILASPLVSVYQAEEYRKRQTPYIRVKNLTSGNIELYQLKAQNIDDENDDLEGEFEGGQITYPIIKGYSHVKTLGNKIENNYNIFNIKHSANVSIKYLLNEQKTVKDLVEIIGNLFQNNILNLTVNC